MMTNEQLDLVKALFAHLKVVPAIHLRDEDTGISIDDMLYISPSPCTVKTIGSSKVLPGYILVGGEGDDIGEATVNFNTVAHQALTCWVNWLATATLDNQSMDALARELHG